MLQPLGCIIKQLCTKNEMRTKHSRSPMHTRFPLLLDNIVSMSALVSVCVTSTFYSSTIKSPLLSYCMLQYSPFTHGICTFIIYFFNWMLCFYCLLFRVSFSILEHATAPKLGRGDHLGWHCFFFCIEGVLLACTKYDKFLCRQTMLDGWPKVAAVASGDSVRVLFH